jgi:hypothetical protein
MQYTKSYADLLKELFSQYKEEEKTVEFEAYTHSADRCRVIPLTVKNCPSWLSPSIFLKQYGKNAENVELSIAVKTPEEGYNKEIHGVVYTAHSTIQGSEHLWGSPERTIGGASRVMCFDNDSVAINQLIIDFILKVQKFISTGLYGPKEIVADIETAVI